MSQNRNEKKWEQANDSHNTIESKCHNIVFTNRCRDSWNIWAVGERRRQRAMASSIHNGTITIKFQIGTHIGKIEIIKLGIVFRFFLINVEIHRNFIETMCCYWISTVEQPNECVCVNVNGIWNWVHTKVIIDREPVECAGNSIPSNSANANAL